MALTVKKITTKKQLKEFFKIFDYWHKQGKIGFVPLFILYRVMDEGQLSLLKDNNQTRGIAWMIPRQRPYQFQQLKTFAIDKDYLGQGYGEKFLRKIIEPLQKEGFDITTSVLTDNKPALKLYRKLGFRKTETKTSAKGLKTYEMKLKAKN